MKPKRAGNWLACAAALAIIATGCGDVEVPPVKRRVVVEGAGGLASQSASPAGGAKKKRVATGWGTIKGRLIWGPSQMPQIGNEDVQKERDHCLLKGPIPKEDIVVNPDTLGVAHILAYLKDGEDLPIHPDTPQDAKSARAAFLTQFETDNNFKFDELQQTVAATSDADKRAALLRSIRAPAVIDQLYCRYMPHAIAVRQGVPTIILNAEKISHNVKITDPNGRNDDNQTMPNGSVVAVDWLSGSSPMKIVCNVHGWMNMIAMTFDHPFFDVTKSDGSFEIQNVPAGDVELVLWGTKRIERGKKLTIKDGETLEVEVTYDFEPNKAVWTMK